MKEKIIELESKFKELSSSKVLHILSGECMFKDFDLDNSIFVPFNEAMCWGVTDKEIFSNHFIEKRIKALKTPKEEYKINVLDKLKPLFENNFDVIVLWFGSDMFCQINLITILAYLDQTGYDGKVLFCMIKENDNNKLIDVFCINIKGYLKVYIDVLCNHKMSKVNTLNITYKAIIMYLNYRNEDSPIIKYINENKDSKNLIDELLLKFPQYGLGDLQYQMIVDEYKKL